MIHTDHGDAGDDNEADYIDDNEAGDNVDVFMSNVI